MSASPSPPQRAEFRRVSPDVDSTAEQMTDLASSQGDKSTSPTLSGLPPRFVYICLYSLYDSPPPPSFHFLDCLQTPFLLCLNRNHNFVTRQNTKSCKLWFQNCSKQNNKSAVHAVSAALYGAVLLLGINRSVFLKRSRLLQLL